MHIPKPTNYLAIPVIFPALTFALAVLLPSQAAGQTTTNVWGSSSGLWTDAASWASGGVPLTNVTDTGPNTVALFTNTTMVTASNTPGGSNTWRQLSLADGAKLTMDAAGGFFGTGTWATVPGNGVEAVFTNGQFFIALEFAAFNRSSNSYLISGASTVFTNGTLADGVVRTTILGSAVDGGKVRLSNSLTVSEGATFVTGNGLRVGRVVSNTNNVAGTTRSDGNTMTITGSGTTASMTADLTTVFVGEMGNSSILNSTNATANNNRLIVSDNATLQTGPGNTFYIGANFSTNASTMTSGNSIEVGSGATAEFGRGFIGRTSATSTSNRMVLTGGSITIVRPDVAESLRVIAGAGNGNSLEVSGGTLTTRDINIGTAGSSGAQANLKMDGGTINAGVLTIDQSRGRFADTTAQAGFNGGTLNVSNLVHNRATLFTLGDGAGTAATLNLLGGATNRVASGMFVNSDGTLTGSGVIAADTAGNTATFVRNAGTISADGQTLRVVGSLTNQSGATLSVANGGTFIASAASTNAGTVNIGSGSAATFSNGLSSAGALIVDGTLTGTTTISSGGVLSGSGTMASAVTIGNGGTLAIGNSPGTMTFEENLTLDLNSTSIFEINGFGAGQFDLAQGGDGTQTVTFGGTLELVFSGGFNTLGSVKIFDFENYGSSFTGGVTSTGLADGYTATFNELDGVVTVVPEPSTYALLALSAVGLAAHMVRRRRRS